MELTSNGKGDYGTWCALLVSSGDTERSTVGFDASQQFTPAQALAAASAGYTHIGRYTVGASKSITSAELAGLKAAGLLLFPIQQRFNNSNAEMTQAAGRTQGIEALERCRALGLPDGSTVFFAVDYDPVDTSIAGPVTNFFVGAKGVMEQQLLGNYQVGIYGTRNVCDAIIDSGLASRAFIAGMSTGWSGNMGFRMPQDWSYNQIVETTEVFNGATIGIDRVVVSSNAVAVDLSSVMPPPTEKDWSPSATGFDVLFQWIVSAEATVERALSEASSFTSPVTAYSGFIPFFVLGWLRKPDYWTTGLSAALWKVYTPEPVVPDILALARGVSELALDGMSDIRTMVDTDIRDVPHMAVTTLGYLEWGIASDPDEYALGDLGGWTLDLLQLWGQYAASFSSEDLGTWMASMIGKIGGVGPSDPGYLTDPASAFGYADVLADADARLLADAVLGDSSGRALSTAMRSQFQQDGNDRIERFYADNFAADPGNVSAAFTDLVDGLDIGPIPNLPFSTELLKLAAGADYGWTGANMPMPTPAQADTIARAYAAFLASPQR